MSLHDCSYEVVKHILDSINNKYITLPTEISLKQLESKTGCRAQSIGMAFDDLISPTLAESGIHSRKCGTPVRIQLRYK
jgi:hypothetical protein